MYLVSGERTWLGTRGLGVSGRHLRRATAA
jgi:hypothetical protein